MIISVKTFWPDELRPEIFSEIEEVFPLSLHIRCNSPRSIPHPASHMFHMWTAEMILICMFSLDQIKRNVADAGRINPWNLPQKCMYNQKTNGIFPGRDCRARTGKSDRPRLPLRRMVKEKFLISTNYLDNNLQNFTY